MFVLQASVSNLNHRGVLVVASAGNDALDTDTEAHVPSTLPNPNVLAVSTRPSRLPIVRLTSTITRRSHHAVEPLPCGGVQVGALDQTGALWTSSNYGVKSVDLVAPGAASYFAAHLQE
jgi:subtilisin family serine protease